MSAVEGKLSTLTLEVAPGEGCSCHLLAQGALCSSSLPCLLQAALLLSQLALLCSLHALHSCQLSSTHLKRQTDNSVVCIQSLGASWRLILQHTTEADRPTWDAADPFAMRLAHLGSLHVLHGCQLSSTQPNQSESQLHGFAHRYLCHIHVKIESTYQHSHTYRS